MFCPDCQSEYRKGIDTCTTCEVKLVPQLTRGTAHVAMPETLLAPAEGNDPLVSHCGFLSLDDARQARETLRAEGIRSDILIRYAAPVGRTGEPEEEFWLRVPASMRDAVDRLLGEMEDVEEGSEESDAATVACSDCGKPVAEDETFCPHCGAQFE